MIPPALQFLTRGQPWAPSNPIDSVLYCRCPPSGLRLNHRGPHAASEQVVSKPEFEAPHPRNVRMNLSRTTPNAFPTESEQASGCTHRTNSRRLGAKLIAPPVTDIPPAVISADAERAVNLKSTARETRFVEGSCQGRSYRWTRGALCPAGSLRRSDAQRAARSEWRRKGGRQNQMSSLSG